MQNHRLQYQSEFRRLRIMSEQKEIKWVDAITLWKKTFAKVVYRHCKKSGTYGLYKCTRLHGHSTLWICYLGKTFSVFWIRNLKNWDMRIFLYQCLFKKVLAAEGERPRKRVLFPKFRLLNVVTKYCKKECVFVQLLKRYSTTIMRK